MSDRYYFGKDGSYRGKSTSSIAPKMGGGGGIIVVGLLMAYDWASHHYWLILGCAALAIAAYVVLSHAFGNFSQFTIGHFILSAVLIFGGYNSIWHFHPDKLWYPAEKAKEHKPKNGNPSPVQSAKVNRPTRQKDAPASVIENDAPTLDRKEEPEMKPYVPAEDSQAFASY